MLVSGQQTHYVIDMKKDDVLFWYADIGWITGQTWTVYGSLITGGTSLFFDGILILRLIDGVKLSGSIMYLYLVSYRHQLDCS